MLYRAGNSCVFDGIKVDCVVVDASKIPSMLDDGWFKTVAETVVEPVVEIECEVEASKQLEHKPKRGRPPKQIEQNKI